MNEIFSIIDIKFIRYFIIGILTFMIEYFLYIGFVTFLNYDYIISSAIVYAVVFWISFILNKRWTFKSIGNIKKQLLKYTVLFLFNLIVGNVIVMYFLTEIIGINFILSPLIKTSIIMVWNFYIYKMVIYI